MKKKLKLTNENVRFLNKRMLQTIKGGEIPQGCTDYCVASAGTWHYANGNPTPA